jgi:multiple sugar transport system permease protein
MMLINQIITAAAWVFIGVIPAFYLFYIKGYDTRLGMLIGGVIGFVAGFLGTELGLIPSALHGGVTVFGLIVIALLLVPEMQMVLPGTAPPTRTSGPDGARDRLRRLLLATGGILLFLFVLFGLDALVPNLPIDPVLITFLLALLFMFFIVPRSKYADDQSTSQRTTNFAYALTLPTAIIVIGIVIFPVIWNGILSLRVVSVGDLANFELFDVSELTLANFEAQMGFRIDAVPCVTTDAGVCEVDEDGNTVFENPRRYFDDYRGYRTTAEFDLFGTHYAIGVRNPEFYPMITRTFLYTLASTVLAITFGLVAALLVREAFPGRAIFRGFILFPYIAPVISVAFIWQVLLRQNGFINGLIGSDTSWLSTNETFLGISIPLIMVILFQTWRYFPFAFLFLLARIQAIPEDMYEAAKVDGAAPSQRLWFITLPQLQAVFGTLFLLRFIWTFNKFDDVFLLTGPISQTKVIPVAIFESLFTESNVGEASAIAVVMAAILAVVLLIYFRFFLVDEA